MLGKMFSASESNLATLHRPLWACYLGRSVKVFVNFSDVVCLNVCGCLSYILFLYSLNRLLVGVMSERLIAHVGTVWTIKRVWYFKISCTRDLLTCRNYVFNVLWFSCLYGADSTTLHQTFGAYVFSYRRSFLTTILASLKILQVTSKVWTSILSFKHVADIYIISKIYTQMILCLSIAILYAIGQV